MAIILALEFLVFFLIASVLLRLNDTLLEPAFIKEELHKADLFNFAYDDVLPQAIEDADLPLGITLATSGMVAALREVAPPQWLQEQADGAVDQFWPYMTGKTDSFEITVSLADRVEMAVVETKELLRQADAYNLVFEQIVVKVVEDNIGQLVQLPFGVTVTHDEIEAAVREVTPPQCIQAQVERIMDEMLPYMTGKTDSFQISLSLSDRKVAAGRVIDDLADRKLRGLYNSLPLCTPQQVAQLLQGVISGQLPPCRPPGFTYEDVKILVNINIGASVKQAIQDMLPDVWTFTDADLRSWLSAEDEQTLDSARETISQGWTYSDADLRETLTSQGVAGTEQVFDQARTWLGRVRQSRFLLYVVGALSLLSIGSAGSRRFRGKLAWAAVVLGVVALVSYVAVPRVYDRLIVPALDNAQASVVAEGAQLAMTEKGFALAKTAISDILFGMRSHFVLYIVIALIVLGLTLAWEMWRRRAQRQ
ncbi:MAG: hypothetical protein AAB037_00590 [Chloroflexota bacterium]